MKHLKIRKAMAGFFVAVMAMGAVSGSTGFLTKVSAKTNKIAVYENPDTRSGLVEYITADTVTKKIGEITDKNGNCWYQIIWGHDDIGFKGFIPEEDAINLIDADYTSVILGSDGETELESSGIEEFPEDYQALLQPLKEAHPNWVFVPYFVEPTWDTVVTAEMNQESNFVHTNEVFSMKNLSVYNWDTDTFTCGAGNNWILASLAALEYYLEPRNFVTEENIFLFESMLYNETLHTVELVEAVLDGTFMSYAYVEGSQEIAKEFRGEIEEEETTEEEITEEETTEEETTEEEITEEETTEEEITEEEIIEEEITEEEITEEETTEEEITEEEITEEETTEEEITEEETTEEETTIEEEIIPLTYAETFVYIGKKYGVSPVLLASRCRQEQGVNGTSPLISGVEPGFEGYYNYFNVQASGDTNEEVIKNGLTWAVEQGWDSPYKSLDGGSLAITTNYVLKNQDTLYMQKFDVDPEYQGMYWHQYMGALASPSAEGRTAKRSYIDLGVLESSFVFKIPVYTNRPETLPELPTDDTNPNNYLSAISLNEGEYVLDFNYQTQEYTIEVPFACEKLLGNATPVSSRASVEGNGEYELQLGENEIVLVVTAESGDVRNYTMNISRHDVQLSVPEIVSVYSKAQTSAKVTWNPVEFAEGYELFRATDPEADGETTVPEEAEGKWLRVKTITSGDIVQYTNQGLTIGETYYYKVRAFGTDASGERIYSDFSEINYMPAAVVWDNLYSNATFRIRLLWKEINGAHGYQIWRMNEDGTYQIVKTIGDKGNELTNDQGGTTSYSNTDLLSGESYTYKIRAFSIINGKKVFGTYSDEFTVMTQPETPVLNASSVKSGCVELSWNAVHGAAGYQVWMAEEVDGTVDGTYHIIKSITDGEITTYTKYDLESEKSYCFKIRAYTELDGKKTFGSYSDFIEIVIP